MKFDMIAITETWLDDEPMKSEYILDGYDVFHVVRCNVKGGGVALYVKRQHNTKVLANKTMTVENVYECYRQHGDNNFLSVFVQL